MTRRVLAAIPPTSQVLSASPFLDACLFQYDEKLISPVIRPRALAEVRLSSCSLLWLQHRGGGCGFGPCGNGLGAPPHARLLDPVGTQGRESPFDQTFAMHCPATSERNVSLVSSSGKNSRNASASRITNIVLDQVL